MSRYEVTDHTMVEALHDLGYRADATGGNTQNSCLHILDHPEDCKKFLAAIGKEGASAARIIRAEIGWPEPEKEIKMAEKKKGGVIVSLKKICKNGATMDEILEALTTEFPDRDPDKMRSTVRTQLGGRLAASGCTVSKEKVEDRGTVYKIAA